MNLLSVIAHSRRSAVPPVAPPINLVAPLITGDAYESGTLTVSTGTWSGSVTDYSYAWFADGTPVGLDSSTLPVTGFPEGVEITCTVTATNIIGSTPCDASNSKIVTDSPAAPDVLTPGSISGDTTPGATLTATDATFDNADSVSRQWYKNGVATGSTGTTYASTVDGDEVFCRTTAINAYGSTSSDSNTIEVAAASYTHPLLPVLGTAAVKPVCWSNDEYNDAYCDDAIMAAHILGRVNLVWHDQTSSTGADGYNPIISSAYMDDEIVDKAASFAAYDASGWDTSSLPAIAGQYKGQLPVHANIADATRPVSPPAGASSLVSAVNTNYTAGQPVLFLCGGPLTALADAWLSLDPGDRAAWAAKVTVVFVAGGPVTFPTSSWYNEWADSMAARIVFKYFNVVCIPADYTPVVATIANGSTSMTCAATTLLVGQPVMHVNLPRGTHIVSTNGSTTATLSAAATSAITSTAVSIHQVAPLVPKPWILERLPKSAIRDIMEAKERVGNQLPDSLDGDGTSLVTVLDPGYVTTVARYSVVADAVQAVDYDGAGTTFPSHNVPAVTADAGGNLWYCTGVDQQVGTDAWWDVLETAELWTQGVRTFTQVASDSFTGGIGAGWAAAGTSPRGQAQSNAYGSNDGALRFDKRTDSYTADQYTQVKILTNWLDGVYPSPITRMIAGGGTSHTGYALVPFEATGFMAVERMDTGARILQYMPQAVANDTWRIATKGNMIMVLRKQSGGETTGAIQSDGFRVMGIVFSTAQSTGVPGLLIARLAGSNTAFLDDFVGGNVT